MAYVKEKCAKCNGTGFVKDPDGSCHTCWDCLSAGRMNVHSDTVKDSGIKV